jgi:hypothetical protein
VASQREELAAARQAAKENEAAAKAVQAAEEQAAALRAQVSVLAADGFTRCAGWESDVKLGLHYWVHIGL